MMDLLELKMKRKLIKRRVKKRTYCMKDLMENRMDFVVNISMMENILVMDHHD
jgi:hypothetical protein